MIKREKVALIVLQLWNFLTVVSAQGDPCNGGFFTMANEEKTIPFESPGYSRTDESAVYPDNSDCTWDITVADGYELRIVFADMEIEQSNDCTFDYLQMFVDDVGKTNSLKDKPFCGSDLPEAVSIQQANVKLKFVSDENAGKRGFSGQFIVVKMSDRWVDCNFDFGFCAGWQLKSEKESENFSEWTLGIGKSPNIGTGPAKDHSSVIGQGQYMYLVTQGQKDEEMGIVTSPAFEVSASDEYCLEFYYHADGKDVSGLVVMLGTPDDVERAKVKEDFVLRIKEEQGSSWKRVVQDINFETNKLVTGERRDLTFIGMVGPGEKGEIALDDVRLHKARCAELCPNEEYTCDATIPSPCLRWSQVCDGMPDCPSGRDEASCSVDMMTSAAPDLFFNDFTTDGFFIFDQTSQSPLFNDLFAATTAPFLDFFATEGSFFDDLESITLSTFPNLESTTTTALFPTSSSTTTTTTESVEGGETLLPLGSMTTTVDTTIRFTSTTPQFETVDEDSPVDPFESDLTTPLVLEGITEEDADPTITTTTFKFDEFDLDNTVETTTLMTFPPSTESDAVTTLMSFPEMSTTTFNFDASTTSFPDLTTEAKSTISTEISSTSTKSSTTTTTSTEASSTASTTSTSSSLSSDFAEEQKESNDTIVENEEAKIEAVEVNETEVVVDTTEADSTTSATTTSATTSTTTTTTTTINTDFTETTEIPTTSTLDFDNLAQFTTTPNFPESTLFPTFSTTPFFPDELSTTMFSLPGTTTEFVLPTTSAELSTSTKAETIPPVQPTVMTTTFGGSFGANFIQPEVILAESRGNKPQLIALPRNSNGEYVKTSKRHYIIQTPDINTSLYVKFKNLDLPNARDDCSGAKVMAVFGPYTGDTAMPNMPTTMICSDAVLPAFYSNSLHMTIIYPEGPEEDPENTGGMDFELAVVPKSNVEGKDRCNTVMMVGPKKQYIASKDFPNMYPPMAKCAYRIRFDKNMADVLNLHFKAFSLEKQNDGTCHDVVRITSATENFEKKEVLHELCGLRSLQTLTFESNIILEFESDNAVEDAGFFAEVFTMNCERRGLVKRNCGCVPSCDDPSCVCDGGQPSCVCPDPLTPIWNGERCVKLEQCDSANNVREKIKQQLEQSIVVTSSPSTLNLRFNRIANASRYVIKLLNPSTNEVIKGTTATFADVELQDRNNVAVTVGNLESETEYISNVEVFFETATADSVLRNTPVSFQRMVSTSSMDNSITEVDRNNLTVEKLSNTLCLVFNKMISSVDAYKITLNEVSDADFIVQPQRVPITDQRICFYSLKTATEYEISVASISDNLQSAPVSIRVKTLEEDRDWMEKWYKWRYFSFNQWSKMFDSYARVARKKNFWTRPLNLACPALRDNIPCKSNLVTWRDLNGCTFNLCDQAPEFDSRAFDEMATTDSFTSDWEADFRIYKDYLYPQWTALLSAYASLLKSEL